MKARQDQAVFFILGRQGELCAQEVDSYLKRSNVQYEIMVIGPSFKYILINAASIFNPNINHLGGVIKWGIVSGQGGIKDLNPEMIASFIKSRFKGAEPITYGITIWPSIFLGQRFSLKVKECLKDNHPRFVPSQRLVTAKTLIKNKLLDFGTDVNIFMEKDYFFMGSSVQVQDVDEYTRRDMGRPERSMKRGLMPPKLAQMMINLAELGDLNSPILDPFCGSGTILQEAYFMGYKNLIGSDSDVESLEQTRKNLKSLGVPESAYRLINADARHINKKVGMVGAVVTEPYLGPTTRITSRAQIEKINKPLENLYQETLRGISRILPSGRRMVMVVPTRNGLTPRINPEKCDLKQMRGFEYHRPGQIIVRNIKVLQRT